MDNKETKDIVKCFTNGEDVYLALTGNKNYGQIGKLANVHCTCFDSDFNIEYEFFVNLTAFLYMPLVVPASKVINVTEFVTHCKANHILPFDEQHNGRYKTVYELERELNDKAVKDMNNYIMIKDSTVPMNSLPKSLTFSMDSLPKNLFPSKSVTAIKLLPKISDVNILVPDKVIEVVFSDSTKTKAVCREPDIFSLEQGISICIAKRVLGSSGAYNKAVKQGLKAYQDKLKRETEEKAELERIERRKEKRKAYKERKAAKKAEAEREWQIEIQKEAYIRAMEELKQKE